MDLEVGFVNESVMVSDSVLSRIKGFIPWSSSAHSASSMAVQRPQEESRSGLEWNNSQPLDLVSVVLAGTPYVFTWSKDRVLRIWRLGTNNCIRAEVMDAEPSDDCVGSFLRLVATKSNQVMFLVRLCSGARTRFAYCCAEADATTLKSFQVLSTQEFRHEMVLSNGIVTDRLVDFLPVVKGKTIQVWSLWNHQQGYPKDIVRHASSSLRADNIETGQWIRALDSCSSRKPLHTLSDLVDFLRRTSAIHLLQQAYEQYIGDIIPGRWTLTELKDRIFQEIQTQAGSSTFQLTTQDSSHYTNSLQVEVSRFLGILQNWMAYDETGFSLAKSSDGRITVVKPGGLAIVVPEKLVDFCVAHLEGETDLYVLLVDPRFQTITDGNKSAISSFVELLDLLAELSDGWNAGFSGGLTEQILDFINEPVSTNLADLAADLQAGFFDTVPDSTWKQISIASLESLGSVLGKMALFSGARATSTHDMLPEELFHMVGAAAQVQLQLAVALSVFIAIRTTVVASKKELRTLTELFMAVVPYLRLFTTFRQLWSTGRSTVFDAVLTSVFPATSFSETQDLFAACLQKTPLAVAAVTSWHLIQSGLMEDALAILSVFEKKSWLLHVWGHYYMKMGDDLKSQGCFVAFSADIGRNLLALVADHLVVKYREPFGEHRILFQVLLQKTESLLLYQYLELLMKLFEEAGNPQQALFFANLALNAYSSMDDEAVSVHDLFVLGNSVFAGGS